MIISIMIYRELFYQIVGFIHNLNIRLCKTTKSFKRSKQPDKKLKTFGNTEKRFP